MRHLQTLRTARSLAFLIVLVMLTAATAVGQTVLLERGWQFATDPTGKVTIADMNKTDALQWRSARVALSWNAQFDDLRDYMGCAWYRTNLEVPLFSPMRRVLVRFGAVDYSAEVYVNGKLAGSHEGGYTPFTLDITDAVAPGTNELAVRVIDPPMKDTDGGVLYSGLAYDELPHGKQNWYVQTCGIWQPVEVEFRPSTYIEDVHVTPQVDGDVTIETRVQGLPTTVSFVIRDPAGREVARGSGRAEAGRVAMQAHVDAPSLWSPDSPALYTVHVELADHQDVRRERFGFRKFEAREGKLYLNGEPFYMLGALDQDFYPETIYTPPSKEYVREQMLKGKRMGLNMLRCHIKVCDPQYLDAADEVGMLVWYEIPSWNDRNFMTASAAERGERIFAEMVDRDWNHPSIVIQSIINESWGADLKEADQRAWLRAAFKRAKQMTAPLGRLIVDNSACCTNFHVVSDIDDFHQYFSIPDNADKWDRWTADFASRPEWSFSRHGDAERSGKEPLIVSEFGNWGLPKLPKDLPWWFGRDFGGRAVTRPAGVFDRFRDYKFESLFPTYNDLAEATQWHQFKSLKHEIESMRQYGSIQGYVVTEFTDVNWEVNGLMDMWRNPKVYASRLAQIQQPDVVLARLPRYNFVSGETVRLQITASHYGAADWRGARVRWMTQSGASGEFPIAQPPARGAVAKLNDILLRAPVVRAARPEVVSIQVVGANGSVLCENSYEFFVYPATSARAAKARIAVHDPSKSLVALTASLRQAGYNLGAKGGPATLLISPVMDAAVEQHLSRGGRALLLLNSAEALPKSAGVSIKMRQGSDLDGNWVTNFNWARTDAAPFRKIGFGRILGFEAAAITPEYVLQNVPSAAYDDVLAGIFYGWLNDNAALAVQAKQGEGSLLATTFRFAAYGTDPYARNLLDGLISHATGPAFQPKFDWNSASQDKQLAQGEAQTQPSDSPQTQ